MFFTIIYLFLAIQMVFPINFALAQEVSSKRTNDFVMSMNLPGFVKESWEISLIQISEIYPGGHFNIGNPLKRVVSNYWVDIFFTDIKVKARLSFHCVPRKNYAQNASSKLIKSITIYGKSEQIIYDILDHVKIILKNNFPKGIPSIKHEKQVGYFIPTDSEFNGINLDWSISKDTKANYLRIIIQKIQ